MKFLYEYRTRDNVRHDGVITASNREAAFAALKAQGIRPGSLAEAPGFFNKLFGKGKRWLLIGLLGAVCLALGAAVMTFRKENTTLHSSLSTLNSSFDSPVRRQLFGDAAVIEKGIRTGWEDVFTLEGDRFLASFAIPGVPAGVGSTTIEKLQEALQAPSTKHQAPGTSLEARQILAIVNGMKKEINELRASGWTLKEVGAALVKRQDREISYYNQSVKLVEQAKASGKPMQEILNLWEKKNDELRNLGIRLVPMPE